jgi:hypothetical protein
MDKDNSELILEAILTTHRQQLQTLRQRRFSLLRIASYNIILLSILVGFAGIIVQVELSIGLSVVLVPIMFVILAITMAIIKYRNFTEHWGYGLNRERAAEMNNTSRDSAIEELVGIYQDASEKNRHEIRVLDKWIFVILAVMCVSFGSLVGVILLSA